MSNWKIYTTTDGKIALATPYNAKIVAECKRRMGKWINLTVTKKDGAPSIIKAWKLDASHRSAIEALCVELFDTQLIERTVRFESQGQSSFHAPTMDGYDLAGFDRDSNWIKRFESGEPIEIIEIVEDKLLSYGSRNNPQLGGSVTLRLRCRPQALAGGEGWTAEVID